MLKEANVELYKINHKPTPKNAKITNPITARYM